MTQDPASPLFAAALARLAPPPGRALCLDATPAVAAVAAQAGHAPVAIQSWRPLHDALHTAGIDSRPVAGPADLGFDLALVRLGRSRVRNLAALAEGLGRLAGHGILVAAGANGCGPASHARQVGARHALARFHGRAFWLARAEAPPAATLAQWRQAAEPATVPPDGHHAAPGAFAWDRIDRGSALLAASLPEDIAGRVADLGAGWGCLSLALAARCPGIVALDLYEADHASLAAARHNLAPVPAAAFHWHDVARGLPRGGYDAIVANPPFHDDRAADPGLGLAFIRAASAALRPGGRFRLVANRRLPYEAALRAGFAALRVTGEAEGYKLLEATR